MNVSARRKGDPLDVLQVIDRLEVGPVELEPDRLRAPYKVTVGDRSEQTELVYRFEEPVFDPQDPAIRNLADMMAAQVALNYGLFCSEIVLRGRFDGEDRSFLEEMLANTSREIFVMKLLQPNPFLLPSLGELPPVRLSNYTRARLKLEGGPPPPRVDWVADGERFAILSSGGKDSLLSFGILSELGREIHPIFVNESGRHWFTALNAYRDLSARDSLTARVWTNSDRVFSWMLRHLPFVRKDFQRLRSDEYPIRLWTVAVFLFGALPLLRKRGIGRLVIGDEYDTTVRTSFAGIPHYNGLFDQSRFFDHALSRYFQRKGWGVTQFSLLRPLSELLIQKTLGERYPQLLQLQVSCHAAHTEGGRVLPCGRCEKCLRIQAMLVGLGLDPAACGYTPEQIAALGQGLASKGLHQEKAGIEHLAWRLQSHGLLTDGRLASTPAQRREEIEQLRFHPERSPLNEVPRTIREGVLRIALEHAEGAVERVGRQWVKLDVLADPRLSAPDPFERRGAVAEAKDGPGERYLWGELTWPQAQHRLAQTDICLLPIGALEQHGPHLPLDTDAFDADHLAREVASRCSLPKPLVLPMLPYGISYHHEDFPGTVSIGNETLSRLVYDIGMSVARNGISKLIIVNGHGGNMPALSFAAQTINRDSHIFTCVESGETSDADLYELIDTPNDVHAGEIETSTSLATRPHLVDMDAATRYVPHFSSEYLDFTSARSVEWYARTARLSPSGVLGDPTKATREKGERMWQLMVQRLLELVEHLKGLSLEQIYERRY